MMIVGRIWWLKYLRKFCRNSFSTYSIYDLLKNFFLQDHSKSYVTKFVLFFIIMVILIRKGKWKTQLNLLRSHMNIFFPTEILQSLYEEVTLSITISFGILFASHDFTIQHCPVNWGYRIYANCISAEG